MEKENSDRQKVTPERAIQILAKHNVKVTREQAEQILEFMNKFALIAIDVYINDYVEHHME
jgi:hypothetical protein